MLVRIGTRDSALALVQSNLIATQLKKVFPELEIKIVEIKTKGDKILDQSLSKIGDKGLFTKELETALLQGSIDLAIHSLKDLPTVLPQGLEIGAVSSREDIRDVICLGQGLKSIGDIKTIGTSSLRRSAQLKNLFPHWQIIDVRGNLQTRFKKLDDSTNGIDALVLAAAGLHRLDLENRINYYFEPEKVLPAVGQGVLAVEIKENNIEIEKILREAINCQITEKIIFAERRFLRALEGGCQVPIGIYSNLVDDVLTLVGCVCSLDGKRVIKDTIQGLLTDELLGDKLAAKLVGLGASEILKSIRL